MTGDELLRILSDEALKEAESHGGYPAAVEIVGGYLVCATYGSDGCGITSMPIDDAIGAYLCAELNARGDRESHNNDDFDFVDYLPDGFPYPWADVSR